MGTARQTRSGRYAVAGLFAAALVSATVHAQQVPAWTDVRTWGASSDYYVNSTESFDVPEEWRLVWSIRGSSAGSILGITVMGLGSRDGFQQTFSGQGPRADTSYVRGAGRYYLDLTAVGQWSVTVQARR